MTPYEKLQDLTRLGAKWQLHQDAKESYSNSRRVYFTVKLSQDDTDVSFAKFFASMDEAIDQGYDAVMKAASRGIDMRRLAAPTVEHAVPLKEDLNSDISF